MSDDNRDTSELPPPPQRPSKSGEWHAMSDRELMYAILRGQDAAAREQAENSRRLDAIEKRLAEGDDLFRYLGPNLDLLVNSVRELCLERGREDLAQQIDDQILERRRSDKNGTGSDEKTNPGQ